MSGGDDDGMGSGSGSGSGSGTDLEQPARGFQLKSPEITIPAGKEQTWCWYFKTPNTEAFSIKRWVSKMTPGSHHMIVYFTSSLQQPEGTVSQENCGVGGGSLNVPSWIFAAQTIDSDMALPTDDGNGQPLGMDVPPGQAGFIQMHYLNSTDDDLRVHVTVNGEAHDAGVVATKTAAYVTFNGSLDIPAGAMNDEHQDVAHVDPRAQAGDQDRGQGRHRRRVLEHGLGASGCQVVDDDAVLHVRVGKAHLRVHVRQPDRQDHHDGGQRADGRDVHGDGLLLPRDQAADLLQRLSAALTQGGLLAAEPVNIADPA